MDWDLVIFDSDGVLVDSEPIANRILNERLRAIGLPFSLEETAKAFQGRTLPVCLQIIVCAARSRGAARSPRAAPPRRASRPRGPG